MNKLSQLALLSTVFMSSSVMANTCKIEGYTVGFFNGVATTMIDAMDGRDKLSNVVNLKNYGGEKVKYQLFYNDSNVGESGISVLADFAETFDQRTHELEQQSFERWEAFWEIINGRQDSSIIKKISTLVSGFIAFA
ncbi:hypothetical protein [Vibrio atypicus]|uniref:hypothetical protein n=1 Tax=Vibrio atypicus TaxID=558271 RepID=UPI003735FC7B